eukprot:UN11591
MISSLFSLWIFNTVLLPLHFCRSQGRFLRHPCQCPCTASCPIEHLSS